MKKLVTAVILVVCLIIGSVFLTLRQTNDNDYELYIYFFNNSTGIFEPETRNINYTDIETRIQLSLGHLRTNPSNSLLRSTWPKDANGNFLDFEIEYLLHANTNTLVLAIHQELDQLDRTLFNASITFTLEYITNRIIISYEDNLVDIVYMLDNYEDEDIQLVQAMNNPPITPGRVTTIRTFTLYFANEALDSLVTETRTGTDVDLFQVGNFAVQLLTEGPSGDNAIALIPPETRVISVTTFDANIYVNLSSEFYSRFTGDTHMARLMIMSIVNTLADIPDFTSNSRINFLIESASMDQFHGISNFHMGFFRDDPLLQN